MTLCEVKSEIATALKAAEKEMDRCHVEADLTNVLDQLQEDIQQTINQLKEEGLEPPYSYRISIGLRDFL